MRYPRGLAVVLAFAMGASAFVAVARAQTDPVEQGIASRTAGQATASRRRAVPETMVLCRGPRGSVYARDAKEGCRKTRLDASNLVDFGAADDCVLRRATAFDPDGAKTSSARTCGDICSAAGDDRSCIVALRRSGDSWGTFSTSKSFAPGAEDLRDAIAVCCGR